MANFNATASLNIANTTMYSYNVATFAAVVDTLNITNVSDVKASFVDSEEASFAKGIVYSYQTSKIQNMFDTNGRPVKGQVYPR